MRRSSVRVAAMGALLGSILSLAGAGSALADGVAYAPPGSVWGAASYSDTATFGSPGYKQDYTWNRGFGSSTGVCVQAWGFDAAHPKGKWFGAGCGGAGYALVPWGYRAATPKLRAKSYSLVTGAFVQWYD